MVRSSTAAEFNALRAEIDAIAVKVDESTLAYEKTMTRDEDRELFVRFLATRDNSRRVGAEPQIGHGRPNGAGGLQSQGRGGESELARQCLFLERAWSCWAQTLVEMGRVTDARAVLLAAEPLHSHWSAVLHRSLAQSESLMGQPRSRRNAPSECA